jgi:hypothetical protein
MEFSFLSVRRWTLKCIKFRNFGIDYFFVFGFEGITGVTTTFLNVNPCGATAFWVMVLPLSSGLKSKLR